MDIASCCVRVNEMALVELVWLMTSFSGLLLSPSSNITNYSFCKGP